MALSSVRMAPTTGRGGSHVRKWIWLWLADKVAPPLRIIHMCLIKKWSILLWTLP